MPKTAKAKKKVSKSKAKIVNISTDKYGFRNTIDFKDSDFILIGDSMLHNHRIDDNNLINNINELENNWKVDKLAQKPVTQTPFAPFFTSTLQQEGIKQFFLERLTKLT